jgi:hypothetical protein
MEARAADGGGRFAVVATLIAAAIGGIFGLTGSAIGYLQAKESLEHSDKQHLQDVRREVYSDILDSWSGVRQRYLRLEHALTNDGKPVPTDSKEIDDAYYSLKADLDRVDLIAPSNVASSANDVDRVFLRWSNLLSDPRKSNYTTDMATSLHRELSKKITKFQAEARQSLTQ